MYVVMSSQGYFYRGSFITGKSVHNQRIGRLSGEVGRCVVRHYKSIFNLFKAEFLFDPLNEMHLFALHYLHLPRINKALAEFTQDWNFHLLSSANNQSPRQFWYSGITLDLVLTQLLLRFSVLIAGITTRSMMALLFLKQRHPMMQLSQIQEYHYVKIIGGTSSSKLIHVIWTSTKV